MSFLCIYSSLFKQQLIWPACHYFTLNSSQCNMCREHTPWTLGHLFTAVDIQIAPLCSSVNICVPLLHVCLHLSLSFPCPQEYKESPHRERISHSERGEDRHGLPSTEDHLSSDSEGRSSLGEPV